MNSTFTSFVAVAICMLAVLVFFTLMHTNAPGSDLVAGGIVAGAIIILAVVALSSAGGNAKPTPYHAPHCVVVHDYRYCGGTKQ